MVSISKPPLLSFVLRIEFPKVEDISFEKIAGFESTIKNHYPKIPKINLLRSSVKTGLQVPIEIRPLVYASPEGDTEIHLFADALVFTFRKYPNWKTVKKQIERDLSILYERLGVEKVDNFWIEYVDIFHFPSDEFKLKDYFNLYHNVPESWLLNYTDFHLGIHLKSDKANKFIIRLRGITVHRNV